jgi:hypothetical protein
MQFKQRLKAFLVRTLLGVLVGRQNTPRLLAYVEDAQAIGKGNIIIKRAHVHKSIKETVGSDLSKSELNLAVELAVQLDRLIYQK